MSIDLFDLDKTQLLAVAEAAAGARVAELEWDAQPAVGDSRADRRIAAFRYTTQDGQAAEAVLFVKRCVWHGRSEAVHYRHLASWGVPTARLIAEAVDPLGREIIFLERLSAIGFRSDSELEWRAMLSLLARLNACEITPDYIPHLYPYEQIGRLDGFWICGLCARPTRSEIEGSLRSCGAAAGELPALCRSARALFTRIAAQPRGLVHQDFSPDNVGWRGDRDEMVVIDPPKCGLGPRFADVAPYLALPDWSCDALYLDRVMEGVTRRESFIRHYLDEYSRFGGPMVSPATFRRETTALSWAHKVAILPWLVERQQHARIREVLEFLRTASSRATARQSGAHYENPAIG